MGKAKPGSPSNPSRKDKVLWAIWVCEGVPESFWSWRLHGHSTCRCLVACLLLRGHTSHLQCGRRGVVVARICVAQAGTSAWQVGMDCSRRTLGRVPHLLPTHSLGHGAHVPDLFSTRVRLPKASKHVARGHRTHFRKYALPPAVGPRRSQLRPSYTGFL